MYFCQRDMVALLAGQRTTGHAFKSWLGTIM